MNTIPTIEPGRYQHYKGNFYTVLGIGRHTETDEYQVIYQPEIVTNEIPNFWVRPYDMFVETVDIDGETIPRFKQVI